jgi:hypothetical protein
MPSLAHYRRNASGNLVFFECLPAPRDGSQRLPAPPSASRRLPAPPSASQRLATAPSASRRLPGAELTYLLLKLFKKKN